MVSEVRLRSVAVPAEHGGWSLTLEPVLLGLLVAPSLPGTLLGVAALFAFLARTPAKILVGDRLRELRHPRSEAATRFVVLYGVVTGLALVGAAVAGASPQAWWVLAAAAPLFAVQFAFDVRARGRRLLPELAGTVGAGAFAAAVAVAGGASLSVGAGLWMVMALRSLAAIPFVRVQLRRAKARHVSLAHGDGVQATVVAAAALAWQAGFIPVAGLAALAALAVFHVVAVRLPVPATPIIGAQQVVGGLTVVFATALGVLAPPN